MLQLFGLMSFEALRNKDYGYVLEKLYSLRKRAINEFCAVVV